MDYYSNSSCVGFFLYSPNDKMILIHKRDDKSDIASPKMWDYFGGSLDPIDQGRFEEALTRELYEELGISVDKNNIRMLVKSGNEKMYYILFPKYKSRELKLGEGAGFAWFSFNEAFCLKEELITSKAKAYLKMLSKKTK